MYLQKFTVNDHKAAEGKRSTLVLNIGDDSLDAFEIWGGRGGNRPLLRVDGDGNMDISGGFNQGQSERMWKNSTRGGRYWGH